MVGHFTKVIQQGKHFSTWNILTSLKNKDLVSSHQITRSTAPKLIRNLGPNSSYQTHTGSRYQSIGFRIFKFGQRGGHEKNAQK